MPVAAIHGRVHVRRRIHWRAVAFHAVMALAVVAALWATGWTLALVLTVRPDPTN
jgi:hypothetical protein